MDTNDSTITEQDKLRQDQLLAQLKAQQEEFDRKFTRISFHGTRLADGPGEDAEGAFDVYVQAVAQERQSPVAAIKQQVQAADTFDPADIEARLHEEALRARQKEASPTGRQSVAGKKMAAYVRQEHLVKCLQFGYEPPAEDRYEIRRMPRLS